MAVTFDGDAGQLPTPTFNMTYPIDHMAELWRRAGYAEPDVRLLVKQETAKRSLRSPVTGQMILNHACLLVDGGCTALTFLYWTGDTIAATDTTGRRYVLVGHYVGAEYLMLGMVKENRKGARFTWLGNGQASTNAKQVYMFTNTDRVTNPEVSNEDIACAIGVRLNANQS